jgi:eukaryotic-like serine/threonine-protein kinase
MLQRWTKTVAFLAITTVLFTACRKSEFSPDNPLPEVFSPMVFTASQNNFLYALNPNTGVKVWEMKLPVQGLQATPVVIGDYMYLAMDSLYKVDVKKGKMIKVYHFPGKDFDSFYHTPLVDGNKLFLGSLKGTLFAFDVTNESILWAHNAGSELYSSPTSHKNNVIIGTNAGNIVAVDKNSGTQVWQYTTTSNRFLSSPTIGNTTSGTSFVYAGGVDGKLHVLDAATGNMQWNYTTGGAIVSSPIAYGGNIVFGSYDYYVYCIDTIGKKERWKYKTNDRVISSPFGDNNVIYVGSYDYNMYALNIIDGSERWKFRTKALVKTSPLVHEGTVYFGSFDKYLYAVDTSGQLKWSHNTNGLIESSPAIWDLSNGFYPSTSGNSIY